MASQEHFIDLCWLLGEPTPAEADPTGEVYCFERGACNDTPMKPCARCLGSWNACNRRRVDRRFTPPDQAGATGEVSRPVDKK